jgi:hypothetical protein
MSEVFLCETGQLDDRSKRDLRKAGVVVVEVADPSKCQFIRSTEMISHDDMLWAAFKALNHNGGSYSKGNEQREQLARNLMTVLDATRKPPAQP